MVTVLEKQAFARPRVPGGYRIPDLVEGIEFRRCTFEEWQGPLQRLAFSRPTVRNVVLSRCHVTASDLCPVIAEDCTIDTITFHRGRWGPQVLAGCAMKHVVVKGKITGNVRIDAGAPFRGTDRSLDDPFIRANRAYYESVDWALDISEALFTGIEMERAAIPARLIRRDPETQVVITRELAETGAWWEPLSDTYWRYAMTGFVRSGFDDFVLVACKRSRDFDKQLEWLRRLRAAGAVAKD